MAGSGECGGRMDNGEIREGTWIESALARHISFTPTLHAVLTWFSASLTWWLDRNTSVKGFFGERGLEEVGTTATASEKGASAASFNLTVSLSDW